MINQYELFGQYDFSYHILQVLSVDKKSQILCASASDISSKAKSTDLLDKNVGINLDIAKFIDIARIYQSVNQDVGECIPIGLEQ